MAAQIAQWDASILLIADPAPDKEFEGAYDRHIDQPGAKTVEEIYAALASSFKEVYFVSNIPHLTEYVKRRPDTLVFPYWFGQKSRSRHGFVPAICEANNIKFVGADSYAKIVCNDKELAKAICKQSGLRCPKSVTVRSLDEMRHLRGIKLPVIVKPNYEGSSLGITGRNKCSNWSDARTIAHEIIKSLGQPVIIEEFIVGREFSACLIEENSNVILKAGYWSIDDQDDYLDDKVFTYNAKSDPNADMKFVDITDQITSVDKLAMTDCFNRLGKVEFMRIDGRLSSKGVVVIELTPDAYLGANSEFSALYLPKYGAYKEILKSLVINSINRYEANRPIR